MGNSILSIGMSGLYAAQAGLLTTSHNISNASTPGYSRQQIVQGSAAPQFTGSGFVGQGTTVETVRRVYDNFLTTRAQQTQAASSQLDTNASHVATLDAMFGDPKSGLAPAVSDFFASVNGVANNPADIPSRQVMLTGAQSLAGRFNDLADQLNGIRSGVNAEITGAVNDVNTAAGALARLNQQIALAASTAGPNRPPNDLLDQRDALLADLNKQIGATVVTQSDGTLDVYLAGGEPLVVGQRANKLIAVPGNDDPQNLQVGLVSGASTTVFRSTDVQGGILGGTLQYRTNVLDPAQDQLGSIALALAANVNGQQALGQDLNGLPGSPIFKVPVPQVQGALSNTGSATVNAGIASTAALTGSNYQLQYDGTNYKVTRLSDQTAQTFATLPQTVDGLAISLGSGAIAAGDSFLIQPTRQAAADIGVALTSARGIAAATPIRTSFALANAGSGTISAGSIDANYLASPLASPVTFTYDTATGTFSGFPATQAVTVITGASSTTYAAGAPVPYTVGATMTFGGISVAVSGAPANNDTFTVAPNVGGSGDGRNALLLGALATKAAVVNGAASLTEANGQLTSFIGTMAHQSRIEADSGAALLSQSMSAQQSFSGVNLDEEAANLMRYQQAYQAAGKVMAIADSLFQSILAIAA